MATVNDGERSEGSEGRMATDTVHAHRARGITLQSPRGLPREITATIESPRPGRESETESNPLHAPKNGIERMDTVT
jgi:hypothetical protein